MPQDIAALGIGLMLGGGLLFFFGPTKGWGWLTELRKRIGLAKVMVTIGLILFVVGMWLNS